MKGTSSFGWQTSLADLALILFMLSAASLHNRPASQAKADLHASAQSEPLAVYHAAAGAPPLDMWLEQQAADPRQQLTITARYGAAPGARDAALAEAARLLAEAGAHGRAARIVVEPGAGPARVALAYDVPER
ncbi:hypothetical protein [Novosphingobium sp. P6W]|uniref:hypothetical protein n=1 Tax=Novosphingobium sp. P6W TaxID=1609758 RepID=UPI0005C2AA11|nr:hypothetical protein [Novosphingobium sp. P6W]AXB75664.1 hypothetical protein TQ38_003315 [Novosphingobium sp. P6W]KIS33111.1 hypothetical protein TQ38_06565 [Novosphingobium sp. P6W]